MIGLAAATASTILLLAVIVAIPGPTVFFVQVLVDPLLRLSLAAYIGCAFVGALFIAQGVVLLLKAATNRSS